MFAEIRKEVLREGPGPQLPFVVCGVGAVADQNPISRPGGFQYHHLIWVADGAGVFSVGGLHLTLETGEALFCRKRVPHGYEQCGSTFRTQWVTFLGGEGLLDYYGISDFMRFRVPSFLPASAETLDQFCEGNSTVVSRSAAGYTWLTELLEAVFAPEAPVAARVRAYLEHHFNEPITLDDVADYVHMSRYALCHAYVHAQGIPVMEQLKRIRIAKAKQFLRYSAWPVAEVGRMCGYDSASYFGKLFRAETGRAPTEYRTQHTR